MAVLLRDALQAELPAIDALCVEAYLEFAPIVGPEAWDEMAANLASASRFAATARFVVAVEGPAVLGFVMYFPPGAADESLFPRDWASFRFLAVARAARGRGLGRLLTEECIRRARADGARHLGLHTSDMMKVAQPLYERMGFRRERELGLRYGLPNARYVMAV